MNGLFSVLNSGESLEKALVLTHLGINDKSSFYGKYDKVKIIYYDNLPKKNKDIHAHGTIGALFENFNQCKKYTGYCSLYELIEDKIMILNILEEKNRITTRIKERLKDNDEDFKQIVGNLPWHLFFNNFKNFLIDEFIDKDFIEFEYLDFKSEAMNIYKNIPNYNSLNKIFLLNPDTSVSSKVLWKSRWIINPRSDIQTLEDSISISPNVYLFLTGSYKYYEEFNLDVGYREFRKSKRPSYDQGINFLKKHNNMIIEPRNEGFGKLLGDIGYNKGIPVEKMLNIGLYSFLNNKLN